RGPARVASASAPGQVRARSNAGGAGRAHVGAPVMTDMQRPLIEVRGLSKNFGGLAAIENLSFAVAPGTIKAVIGPNGAGKTTLFNMLTGVDRPTRGDILL